VRTAVLMSASRNFESSVVAACSDGGFMGIGWSTLSSWPYENIGHKFTALFGPFLSYMSQQHIRALGLVPSLPGRNLITRLNCERNLDYLACQHDRAFDSQK